MAYASKVTETDKVRAEKDTINQRIRIGRTNQLLLTATADAGMERGEKREINKQTIENLDGVEENRASSSN